MTERWLRHVQWTALTATPNTSARN